MDEYEVEGIKNKRLRDGKTEYLIKWKGYSSRENTWEPLENMNCPDLVKAYEQKRKATNKYLARNENRANSKRNTRLLVGFESDLEPCAILGAANVAGFDLFLIKWKNSSEINFLPAKLAYIRCPQLVIKFYEDQDL